MADNKEEATVTNEQIAEETTVETQETIEAQEEVVEEEEARKEVIYDINKPEETDSFYDYKDENNVRVNGDVGTIHESRVKTKKFGKDVFEYRYTIKYFGGNEGESNEETNLSVEDVREAFVPFYASTVHKMQGLQKSVIVFIVSSEHSFCLTNENSKKLVYTAISRCKANFYVVGDKHLFLRSQQSKGTNVYPTKFMEEFNKKYY